MAQRSQGDHGNQGGRVRHGGDAHRSQQPKPPEGRPVQGFSQAPQGKQ